MARVHSSALQGPADLRAFLATVAKLEGGGVDPRKLG
jgi:hypothetical protein